MRTDFKKSLEQVNKNSCGAQTDVYSFVRPATTMQPVYTNYNVLK